MGKTRMTRAEKLIRTAECRRDQLYLRMGPHILVNG